MRAPVLLQVNLNLMSSNKMLVSWCFMSLFQALAPLFVWAELGVGRGGKVPPRGVTLDRARELQRDRGRLWPRNLGPTNPARNLGPANPARNLGPNPHPRDLGSSPTRNLGSSSSRESGSGESEAYPQRNTSTPFIRQSLPPGEQSAGQI